MKHILLSILLVMMGSLCAKSADSLSIDQGSHSVVAPDGVGYQWYINGEKIVGATQKSVKVQQGGNYAVEVYDMTGDTLRLQSSLALNATGAVVKIYIIGDSTVCNYAASAYPQTGWGQILPAFFNTANISITNNAIGGRSSRTVSYTHLTLPTICSG